MAKYGLIILFFISAVSFADCGVDLMHVYADAVKNNPTYQTQLANYQARAAEVSESRAPLLLQVNLTGGLLGKEEDTSFTGINSFNGNNYGLTVTQTLFNAAAFKELARAKVAFRAAGMTLLSQQQDLMIRAANAYFEVLKAEDILNYTAQQKRITYQQLSDTKIRRKHGYATITDVDQSQGAYDLVSAEYYTAKILLYNRRQELTQVTGVSYQKIIGFQERTPLINPIPNRLDQWVSTAQMQNYALEAARWEMKAAREKVSSEKGNFLPTVDAQGTYKDDNELGANPDIVGLTRENVKTSTLGLTMNWNIIEGGLTIAKVHRAGAEYAGSQAEMQRRYLEVLANTRKSFNGIVEGKWRVKRGRMAIFSNSRALRHAQEGYRAGTEKVTDVLQIQTRLFTAEREYADDYYQYILDILLLKQAAGTLSPESLKVVNAWLEAGKSCSTPRMPALKARLEKILPRREHSKPTRKTTALPEPGLTDKGLEFSIMDSELGIRGLLFPASLVRMPTTEFPVALLNGVKYGGAKKQ